MRQEEATENLVEQVLQLGDRAFRELFPILPKQWLQLELTMPQLKVVLLLFLNERARVSEIAAALDVSMATASGVVDRLVDREILARESDPEDRRVVICRLTGRGQNMIAGLWQLARDRAKELLKALDQAQLRLVMEALEALVKAGEAGGRNLRA